MGLHKVIRKIAPVAGMLAAVALAGCDGANIEIDGDGVPLAQLDMTGDPPTGIVLAGSDTLIINRGEEFEVEVTGTDEARERMRFARDGDTLAIHRSGNTWSDSDVATVEITLPALDNVVVAGSGDVTARGLRGDASLVVTGSGTLAAPGVEATSLDIVMAGSGELGGSGTTERLSVNVAGSGRVDLSGLRTARADVNMAGSGAATFASDGEVEANIIGSGNVRVIGSATCKVNTVGSGTLSCEVGTSGNETEGDF